jgi:hypothetical protein
MPVTVRGPITAGVPGASSTRSVVNRRAAREEPGRSPGGAREQDLHRCRHPLPDARRAGDHERALAPAELAVEDEEGNASEVVAVEMREEDAADRSGVDARTLHADEGRGATVDQDSAVGALEAEAGLQAPAGAESVARPEEAQTEPGGDRATHSGSQRPAVGLSAIPSRAPLRTG